jgi:hypothetical protein
MSLKGGTLKSYISPTHLYVYKIFAAISWWHIYSYNRVHSSLHSIFILGVREDLTYMYIYQRYINKTQQEVMKTDCVWVKAFTFFLAYIAKVRVLSQQHNEIYCGGGNQNIVGNLLFAYSSIREMTSARMVYVTCNTSLVRFWNVGPWKNLCHTYMI